LLGADKMERKLELKDIVLVGRTLDEYYKILKVDYEFVKGGNVRLVIKI